MRAIEEFVCNCQMLIGNEKKFSSPLRLCVLQQGSNFIRKFHEDRKTKLSNILDTETWRSGDVPEHFQRIADLCLRTNRLSDVGSVEIGNSASFKPNLLVDGEPYVVAGTAFILLQMMAQYCDALAVLPEYASELLMCLVELLKNYNSRSCQLILGAGALQLIGLKSISVRHLGIILILISPVNMSSTNLKQTHSISYFYLLSLFIKHKLLFTICANSFYHL
ncbi:unnamed protein product [Brugia timori]|uniref:Vps54 domain-containing protein n=1 Tax=Brugia timori TaxID=42155 RepID=A0A0R3RC75_9BILA|nr:unnamed protein product [Brugia timori]